MDPKSRTLVMNFISFLMEKSNEMGDDKKESLEVAIQCLENTFEIDDAARATLPHINLVTHIPILDLPEEGFPPVISVEEAEKQKHLGNDAMKAGNYDLAITHYSEAIRLNSQNAVYYGNRAAALTRLDRNEEAIADCQRAIKIDPKYSKAYGRLGIAYSNLRRYEDARRSYESALHFDPQNTTYADNLKIAQDCISAANERAADTQPRDLREFINSQTFMNVAREMAQTDEFQNIMSGILSMGQSGNLNLETLLQVGSNLIYQVNNQNPELVDQLAGQAAQAASSNNSQSETPRSGSGEDQPEGGNTKKTE